MTTHVVDIVDLRDDSDENEDTAPVEETTSDEQTESIGSQNTNKRKSTETGPGPRTSVIITTPAEAIKTNAEAGDRSLCCRSRALHAGCHERSAGHSLQHRCQCACIRHAACAGPALRQLATLTDRVLATLRLMADKKTKNIKDADKFLNSEGKFVDVEEELECMPVALLCASSDYVSRKPAPTKKRRRGDAEPAEPEPEPGPAPADGGYSEWVRQRNEYKKYFTIDALKPSTKGQSSAKSANSTEAPSNKEDAGGKEKPQETNDTNRTDLSDASEATGAHSEAPSNKKTDDDTSSVHSDDLCIIEYPKMELMNISDSEEEKDAEEYALLLEENSKSSEKEQNATSDVKPDTDIVDISDDSNQDCLVLPPTVDVGVKDVQETETVPIKKDIETPKKTVFYDSDSDENPLQIVEEASTEAKEVNETKPVKKEIVTPKKNAVAKIMRVDKSSLNDPAKFMSEILTIKSLVEEDVKLEETSIKKENETYKSNELDYNNSVKEDAAGVPLGTKEASPVEEPIGLSDDETDMNVEYLEDEFENDDEVTASFTSRTLGDLDRTPPNETRKRVFEASSTVMLSSQSDFESSKQTRTETSPSPATVTEDNEASKSAEQKPKSNEASELTEQKLEPSETANSRETSPSPDCIMTSIVELPAKRSFPVEDKEQRSAKTRRLPTLHVPPTLRGSSMPRGRVLAYERRASPQEAPALAPRLKQHEDVPTVNQGGRRPSGSVLTTQQQRPAGSVPTTRQPRPRPRDRPRPRSRVPPAQQPQSRVLTLDQQDAGLLLTVPPSSAPVYIRLVAAADRDRPGFTVISGPTPPPPELANLTPSDAPVPQDAQVAEDSPVAVAATARAAAGVASVHRVSLTARRLPILLKRRNRSVLTQPPSSEPTQIDSDSS